MNTAVRNTLTFSIPEEYTDIARKILISIGATEQYAMQEDEPFLPEGLLPQYESIDAIIQEADRRYNQGGFIPENQARSLINSLIS